jgi:HPt (histidine-containing phosphotransfer) domain-containing protein
MQTPIKPQVARAPGDSGAVPDLPLIDQSIMNDWCNDMDKEDVSAILACVPGECARSLRDMRKAIEARDVAAARRIAHRLKGMANNLGATRLAHLARAVELGSQSLEDVLGQMPALEQTVSDTLIELRACC